MPEVLEPKAAPTPAPSPTPPPAPAATPPPATAAPPPSHEPEDAFVAELNKKFDDLGVPPAPDKETPKPKEVAKPKEEPAKPETAKATTPKETAEERPTPDGWKKLRADRERLKNELHAREEALAEHERKIAEWEAKGKDTEQLLARLKTLEQERDEAKARERRARREVGDEFKAKWDEPFNEMAEDAAAVFSQLQVSFTDNQGIEQTRPANWEKDFGSIFAMDRGNALRTAKAMFGDEAALVMDYYTRLHENRRGRARELKKVEENWKAEEAKEKEQEAQKAAQEEQNKGKFRELSDKVMKEIAESVDYYHDPADVDKSLAEERRKNYEIWDTKATTLQGELIKRAHARHRFAAHPVLVLKNLRLEKENAELKEKLEGYKPKTPNPKSPGGGGQAPESKESWEEAARRELL